MTQRKPQLVPKLNRRGRSLVVAIMVFTTIAGCSRSYWRRNADYTVECAVNERRGDPQWDVPRIDVYPDPRSRFYDPYDPDCEPLPPDDPAAHRYMHYPGGMRGWDGWHQFGQTFSVENPHWLESFGLAPLTGDDEEGFQQPLPTLENLTLDQAIELSNIHSREYQTQIETLYLTALNLTFERFRFGVRYLGLGGREPTAEVVGTSVPDNQDSVALNSRFGVSRLLPTGAQWIVELANNTLWVFTGQNDTTSASLLSYSLVQPLLRNGGRQIALENLTQSERNLLYSVRDLARFRQQFFTSTVAGGNTFVSTGGNFGQNRGFLGLLQLRQSIINQQGNIRRLEEQALLQRALASQKPNRINEPLPALPAGIQIPETLNQLSYDADAKTLSWIGGISPQQEQQLRALSNDPDFQAAIVDLIRQLRAEIVTLSVAQLESDLATSRTRLRQSEQRYQDALDRFKVQLGLPPDFGLSIDESMLEQFRLIDPRVQQAEQLLRDFVLRWAQLDDDNPDLEQLRAILNELTQLRDQVRSDGLQLIEADFGRVQKLFDTDESPQTRTRQFSGDEERQRVVKDVANDRRLFVSISRDFDSAGKRLVQLTEDAKKENPPVDDRKRIAYGIAEIREQLVKISQSLQVIQIGLRVELITLAPFELQMHESVESGIAYRLDLMNDRAEVMDARRRVEITGNQLEAVLDIVVEGDLGTSGGNRPVDFRGSSSSFRAGVGFTAPLDQINEQNNYRSSLIDYQRARRAYMASQDSVKSNVRQDWRQIDVLKQNFETARQAIRIAALQYDSAVEEANAPVQQGQGRQNQSLNLLNALRDVLQAQESLISFWIDYERGRINIYRDMGIMDIGEDGIWNDPVYLHNSELNNTEGTGIDGGNNEPGKLELGTVPQPAVGVGSGVVHAGIRPETQAGTDAGDTVSGGDRGWHRSRMASDPEVD